MGEIFRFEVGFRLRQVSTYLFAAVLFLMALLFISTDIIQISGGDGRVKGNAPYVLALAGTILTALGAVIASALMGTAVYRDFEANAHELFFTTRLTKRDYLLGRFLGAFVVTLLVFSAIPLGFLAGTGAPWADRANFGPFRPDAYLAYFGVYLVPNLLLIGALFFVFGALTRSLLAIYVQGVLLFVAWAVAQSLLGSLENREIAAVLDPFGLAATALTTRYWTVAEKNGSLVPLTGTLLTNRLLWTGVALAVLAVGYRLFTFSRNPIALRRARQQAEAPPAAAVHPLSRAGDEGARGASGGEVSPPSPVATFARLTRFYFREVVRGVPFLVITVAGMAMLLVAAFQADKLFDTTVYPVTRVLAQTVAGGFGLFFLILITFYAGELTWRERVLRLDQVTDALPVPTAAGMLAKVAAIVLTLTLLSAVLIVTGMFVQAVKGYFNFELPIYFAYLFGIMLPGLVCLTFLAFFLHAVINNKFLGHTAMVLVFLSSVVLPTLGMERQLYRFGSTPDIVYSDMNGFGPFVAPFVWFTLYWACVAILLLVVALRLWVRGKDDRLATRWRTGRLGPAATAVGAVSLLGAVGVGAFTLYNTDVLNRYVTGKQRTKLQAKYETTYKAAWEKKPMPRVAAASLDVDLRPETRQYAVNGTFRLKNGTDKPITEVALMLDPDLTVKKLEFGVPSRPGIVDRDNGFRTFTLTEPLAPGAETTLVFDLAFDKTGFRNGSPETSIAGNGTFVTMPVPRIGYQKGAEIADENERRKQKLPKRSRMAPYTDLAARQNTYLGNDADWIDFEATVRTAPDQIALAPGYLQKEWTDENGRRAFRYKMDAPIRNFYSFLSARYAVKKDTWTGRDGKKVALEIYYHPTHAYNLDRMTKGMKAALDYCSESFSPYQFRQMRILEFPAYAQFAQSFPNTVPYSESIGFIARVNDAAEDIDYPFYVTAHEVAHQWWAHQVLGGDVEGSEMLSESLAEYTALMIMRNAYGPDRIRRFLRYDLDRYLSGRGTEREAENPLVKVQNQQYIHYPKGALVFYALADRIGEERLNATLSRFVKDKGFQQPPYTTAMDLLAYLREDTPAADQGFLTDLFEKITVYDLRATEATSTKLPNGKWRVTLTVSAAKNHSDGAGRDTPAPLRSDLFDVGVFAKPEKRQRDRDAVGKPLAFRQVRLNEAKKTFTFDVDAEPAKAGIDPYNKLIDRIPSDNVTAVKAGGVGGEAPSP